MIYSIDLPLPSSKLINHNNGSYKSKIGLTKKHRLAAKLAAANCPQFKAAKIHIEIRYPDGRLRDALNTQSACKAYIDGFVDAGLIPDDNFKYLRAGSWTADIDRKNAGITFKFTEIENEQR